MSAGYRAWAASLLAAVALSRGDLAAAEEHAGAALDPASVAVVRRQLAASTLVRIRVRQGRAEEALALAEQALAWIEEHGVEGYVELPVRLAVVEARQAAGDAAGARTALRATLERIRARADRIPDADARARYLAECPESRQADRLTRDLPREDP